MADSFQDPTSQASLSAILSKLEQLDGEIDALRSDVAEGAARRSEASSGGAGIYSDKSVQWLREGQAAINEQVLSYERLNELITQRIELERTAAASVQQQAAAVSTGVAPAAVERKAPSKFEQAALFEGEAVGLSGINPASQKTTTAQVEAQMAAEKQAAAVAQATATEQNAALQKERSGYAAAVEEANALRTAEMELAVGIQSATMAMVDSSSAMTAHGALSTEFLGALAKGQVGIQDLGEQVMQTIGKFGGWTIAAAGVYGALGAVNQLREGAVSVNSAVTGLTRFIPNLNQGQARGQLVDQARETATPITDVGNTAQQFAKIFKSQGDVFTATHVALTAAKLDNISLADSYRYLTALTQEWGLSAKQLPAVFDQITAAQDKLGASVSQILPAVARSLSAVKNSGGNLDQLIGLQALTLVRTGQTGNTIGTAFSRGASNFFPNPADRGTLERYGVNPSQGFTQALVQAVKDATTKGWSGLQKEEVAKAFFGSQRGGQLAGLFNAPPKQVDKYLSETASGKYPGLADRQLGIVVGEASNQIKELGINLQAIGAELGGSGLSAPFGLMLEALNEALKLTGQFLSIWNQLPGPIKEVATTLAVVAGVMAGLRRLDIGSALAESGGGVRGAVAPLLRRNPNKILGANISRYAEGAQAAGQQELNRTATANLAAEKSLARTQAQYDAVLKTNAADSEEAGAAAKRLTAAYTRADQALAAATAADEEYAALTAQLATYREGLSKGLNAGTAAAQAGIGTYAAGASSTKLGARGATEAVAGGAGADALAGASAGYAATLESAGAATERTVALEATRADAEQVLIGRTSVITAAFTGATGAIATWEVALESAAAFLATGFGALVAGFASFEIGKDVASHGNSHENNTIHAIRTSATPSSAVRNYNRSLTDTTPVIGIAVTDLNAITGVDSANASVLKSQEDSFAVIRTAQTAAAKNLHEVNDWIRKAGDSAGGSKIKDLQAALAELANNKALQGVDPTQYSFAQGSIQSQLTKTSNKGADPFAEFRQAQTLPNLEALTQGLGKRAQVFGVSGLADRLAAGYAYAVNQLHTQDDKTNMQALTQAKSTFDTAVNQSVSDLETAAKNATTNQGSAADFTQAVATINQTAAAVKKYFDLMKIQNAGNKKAIAELNDAERQEMLNVQAGKQTAISDQLNLVNAMAQLATSQNTGIGPVADLARAQQTLSGARGELSKGKDLGASAQEIDQLKTTVNTDLMTMLQDKVNAIQQIGQAVSQLGQSTTADPVAQAQIAAQAAQQELDKLKAAGDTDVSQLDQLQATINQSNRQAAQALLQQWQAGQQILLTKADTGKNATVQANNAVANATGNLARVLSLGNQVSPDTVLQAYQTLATAQQQLAQEILQEGQALIQARSALAQSTTTNPVTIAKDALAGDEKLLQYMKQHHFTMAQIVQQQAQVGNDIKSTEEAKYTLAQQTTEFQASTYQITGATEIQQLEKTYQQMKQAHASVTALQQIYQEIWNLEYNNTSGLNLNTGAIHLPSTYEVKSAIANGGLARRRTTNAGLLADVKTNVTMNVTVNRDADMHKLTDAIGKALGTSVSGIAQAAGLV